MSASALEGFVIHKSSRNVRVRAGSEVLLCTLRGRFRDEKTGRSPVVVGDRVTVEPCGEGEAVLEEILPRKTEIRRARALRRGRRLRPGKAPAEELVVASNVDQVLIVMASCTPPPRWALIDRVLISTAWEKVEGAICLNKWDQVEDEDEVREDLEECLGVYEDLGYGCFRLSALGRTGIEALATWLKDKVTVFSGHSGVGKSTLINALCPDLDIQTSHVNRVTGKGRHTTTAATLYELPGGGCLIDTPGYREYGLSNIESAQLSRYYSEFSEHLSLCRFGNCLHLDEPGCKVIEAVEKGAISDLRYQNYLQILSAQ